MIGSQKEYGSLFHLVEKHVVFIKTTVFIIIVYAGIILYTYDRSFRIHQDTLSRVLRWNNREGLICSQVHVGHDGTTLLFQVIPKEVGTAGPIDTSILSSGDQQFQTTLSMGMDPFFFSLITLAVFLLIILILWIFYFRSKSVEKNEKEGQ